MLRQLYNCFCHSQVNEAFREAAKGAQAGILAVVDEPLVSVDFRCTDVSTSIDSSLTMVMGAQRPRAQTVM